MLNIDISVKIIIPLPTKSQKSIGPIKKKYWEKIKFIYSFFNNCHVITVLHKTKEKKEKKVNIANPSEIQL